MIIDYEKVFIKFNEAKQVGTIYHITTIDNFYKILESDTLGKGNTVSFSRDKDYSYVEGSQQQSPIQFVLDGNKLSENYKIKPHADTTYFSKPEFARREAEERLYGKIQNLGKYVLEINAIREDIKLSNYERYALYTYIKKYPHIKTNIDIDFVDLTFLEGLYKDGKIALKFGKNYFQAVWDFLNIEQYADDYGGLDSLEEQYYSSHEINEALTSKFLNGYDLITVDPQNSIIFVRTKNIENYDWLKEYPATIVQDPYKSVLESSYYDLDDFEEQ